MNLQVYFLLPYKCNLPKYMCEFINYKCTFRIYKCTFRIYKCILINYTCNFCLKNETILDNFQTVWLDVWKSKLWVECKHFKWSKVLEKRRSNNMWKSIKFLTHVSHVPSGQRVELMVRKWPLRNFANWPENPQDGLYCSYYKNVSFEFLRQKLLVIV